MMLNKYVKFTVICLCTLTLTAFASQQVEQEKLLKIHLPRTAQIKTHTVSLEQIAVLTGNMEMSHKAGTVLLGKLSSVDQQLVIDRKTILSRLASNEVNGNNVTLTGAEEIRVTMQRSVITSETLLKKAREFLEEKNKSSSVCGYEPAGMPEEFVTSGANLERIRIVPSLIVGGNNYYKRVKLSIMKGDEKVSERTVSFRLKFSRKAAVAKTNIPLGSEITSENTEIKKIVSGNPPTRKFVKPYGLVARRPIPSDTVIESYMVGSASPELVIERNQSVFIKVERPGLFITTMGKALQNGHQGEIIKVKNVSSDRVIYACVNDDGSVSPAY